MVSGAGDLDGSAEGEVCALDSRPAYSGTGSMELFAGGGAAATPSLPGSVTCSTWGRECARSGCKERLVVAEAVCGCHDPGWLCV